MSKHTQGEIDKVSFYDALAEQFHNETNYIAPGKDIPSAMGTDSTTCIKIRMIAWDKWLERRNPLFLNAPRTKAEHTKMLELLNKAKLALIGSTLKSLNERIAKEIQTLIQEIEGE